MVMNWKLIAAPAILAVALTGCNRNNNAAAPGTQPGTPQQATQPAPGNTANAPVQPASPAPAANRPSENEAARRDAERREAERRNRADLSRNGRPDQDQNRYNNAAPTAPSSPAAIVIPAQTTVIVRTNDKLAASTNQPGDGFTGTLERPITINGTEVFRRGTEVRGSVVAAKGLGRFKGSGDLGIELTSIGGYRVQSSEYEQTGKGRGKRTAEYAAGGGGVGALIGGLAGGGKGALIGALAGAGAGTAANAYTGNRDVVIPAESSISFTLLAPVTVR